VGTYRKLVVTLPPDDLDALRALLRGGVQSVRVVHRSRTLMLLHEGQSPPAVARAVGITAQAVRNIAWRYEAGGLERALTDAPRPGGKPALDATQSQQIVAMVCADPPHGFARWTVRLIAEEAVKRKLTPSVGRETIRLLLLNHDLKPWREKKLVHRRTRPRIRGQDGRRSGGV
jgi:putative transposase